MDVSTCIETSSGRFIDLNKPDRKNIMLSDIVKALSRIPRFLGHTKPGEIYSVAQHSVHVAILAKLECENSKDPGINNPKFINEIMLKALLHDAHEAYMGDIPSPLKKIDGLSAVLKPIESRLDDAIFSALRVDPMTQDEKRIIKYCDGLAQAIEGHHLMPSLGTQWNLPTPTQEQLDIFESFHPKNSSKAEELFLYMYASIKLISIEDKLSGPQ